MSSVIQRSLSGGELDPALWPRSDTSKYMTGLRTLRNGYVRRNGGVCAKPGSSLVSTTKLSAKTVRLLPFIYSQQVTYVMEFGDKYIRFYQNGQPYLALTGSAYNSGSAYQLGNLVLSAGINYYCCFNTGGTTSTIAFAPNISLTGAAAATTTGHLPSTSPGMFYPLSGPYEIPTPWAYTDLPLLRFDQTANDVIISHPSYPPMRLTRTNPSGADVFNLYLASLGSYMQPTSPHNDQGDSDLFASGAAGVITYAITAVGASGDEYAETGLETQGATSGVDGIPPSIGITTTKTIATLTQPVKLIWAAVPNAVSYNIYVRNANGVYGFLGSTALINFIDEGFTPDFANPWVLSTGQLFAATNSYPTACAYYQQRSVYANTNSNPTKSWASQTGLPDNFNVNIPTLDSDSLSFKMAGQQDVVEHLLYLGVLIVFTYGTINSIQGDASGAISPSAINPHRESVHGSSALRPLVIGEFAIYNQSQGSIIRDLGFNFQVDGYRGDDLTVFATHLFDNYTISDWSYQSVPNSIVWAVRSDGTLLSLTYVREQQILAWAHHDTAAGFYENVCCIPEGNQVSVYVVTNRTINGTTSRFVERFYNQQFPDVRNYIGMDCATTFDGRNTTTDTITISGGTLWNEQELLTLTLSANNFASFTSGMATNNTFFFIYDAAGKLIRFKITAFISATVVHGMVDRTVYADLQGVATATWSLTTQTVGAPLGSLAYLDGQNVSVFADGCVVGSPNNPAYPVYTVSSGLVTLDQFYAVIHVGLPFITDIETLDIDTPGPMENLGGKFKLIGEVTLYMVNSRSVFVGGKNPDTDLANTASNPVYRLTEQKLRKNEGYDLPLALQTGKVTQNIQPDWDQNGHVFIRNVDPTPMTISAISPDGLVPTRSA